MLQERKELTKRNTNVGHYRSYQRYSSSQEFIQILDKTRDLMVAELSEISSVDTNVQSNPNCAGKNDQIETTNKTLGEVPMVKQNATCTVAANGKIIATSEQKASKEPKEVPENKENYSKVAKDTNRQLKKLKKENKALRKYNEGYKERIRKLNNLLKSNEEFILMIQEEMNEVHNENQILATQTQILHGKTLSYCQNGSPEQLNDPTSTTTTDLMNKGFECIRFSETKLGSMKCSSYNKPILGELDLNSRSLASTHREVLKGLASARSQNKYKLASMKYESQKSSKNKGDSNRESTCFQGAISLR